MRYAQVANLLTVKIAQIALWKERGAHLARVHCFPFLKKSLALSGIVRGRLDTV